MMSPWVTLFIGCLFIAAACHLQRGRETNLYTRELLLAVGIFAVVLMFFALIGLCVQVCTAGVLW